MPTDLPKYTRSSKEYHHFYPLWIRVAVGKYLTSLLNPLTQNQYHLNDSFDAADRINQIPDSLYDEGYRLVSFNVKSLFTNVPLSKTIEVILDRIYNKNQITSPLKKRTLKKLIDDTCSKAAYLEVSSTSKEM